jgi:hypothetical protein
MYKLAHAHNLQSFLCRPCDAHVKLTLHEPCISRCCPHITCCAAQHKPNFSYAFRCQSHLVSGAVLCVFVCVCVCARSIGAEANAAAQQHAEVFALW